MDFEELLDQYKTNPRRESAVLLLNDARLLSYAVIFKQCPPERVLEYGSPAHPEEATWNSLWECVRVNYDSIALLADDELVKAKKNIERLKGLRLIYPDGTLPDLATKIITKRIMEAL